MLLAFDDSVKALFNPGDGEPYFVGLDLKQFEPGRVDYSPRNAWWLAELSRIIYRRSSVEGAMVRPDRSTILQNAGLRESFFGKKERTQGAVISAPGFDVLVFRGSEEGADWLTNLNGLKDRWDGNGKVHVGFRQALDEVWDDVTNKLQNVRGPLFLTGHSLGGALAILAGARLGRDGVKRAVYAYGTPRVGNSDFVNQYPSSVTVHRVINDDDAVATVPPALLGYRHVGEARVITEDGKLIVGQPMKVPALFRSLDKAVQRVLAGKGVALPDYLSDHAPVNYVAWMQRLV
jgi:hypothetical protein